MIGKNGLIDTYYLYQSVFTNPLHSFEIFNDNQEGINGSSQKLNKKNAIKASMGEHIERTSLYKNTVYRDQKKVPAFNVKTLTETWIEFKYINLMFRDDYFFDSSDDMNYFYNDSSGVGSHIYSESALKSGFFEFIERQSLVYSFLTKRPGKKITSKYLFNKDVEKIYKLALNFFENIDIYEISFFEDVFVVLSKSRAGKRLGMGLSASTNLFEAIQKSLEELLSCSFKNLPYLYGDLENSLHKPTEIKENDPHFYGNYFFTVMNTKSLDNSYEYLSSNNLLFEKEFEKKEKNIIKVMNNFANIYDIDLLIIYIPVENIKYPNKVLKIWSSNAFPHIHNQKINPELYSISKSIDKNVSFPNKEKYLPFP